MDETVDLATLTHDDKCRHWDDEEFCDCGAIDYELLMRCRIERDRYKSALGRIAAHLLLPCDKRDDGILEQIVSDALATVK